MICEMFLGERCEKVTQCIEGKGKLENGRCKCEDRWTGVFCQTRMCHNGISIGSGAQVIATMKPGNFKNLIILSKFL